MQHEPGALQNPTMLLTFIQQYNGKPKGRQHEASAREICSFGLLCGLLPIRRADCEGTGVQAPHAIFEMMAMTTHFTRLEK